jgi:hypothetical protein
LVVRAGEPLRPCYAAAVWDGAAAPAALDRLYRRLRGSDIDSWIDSWDTNDYG